MIMNAIRYTNWLLRSGNCNKMITKYSLPICFFWFCIHIAYFFGTKTKVIWWLKKFCLESIKDLHSSKDISCYKIWYSQLVKWLRFEATTYNIGVNVNTNLSQAARPRNTTWLNGCCSTTEIWIPVPIISVCTSTALELQNMG